MNIIGLRALTDALRYPVRVSRSEPYVRYAVYALELAILFAAYFITGKLGLSIDAVAGYAAPIWPPAGLAVASLYLLGYRLFPAILAAAFFVNFTEGASVFAALGIAIGNTGEALLITQFLRLFNFDPLFDRLRDSILMITGAIGASLTAATIGVTSLSLAHSMMTNEIPLAWFSWLIGDLLSILVIAPLIIRWFCRPLQFGIRTMHQFFEAIAFFLVLIIVTITIFWEPLGDVQPSVTLPFLIFIPLIWGALRVGPRFAFLAVATMAGIAITGTVQLFGPFSASGPHDLISLQLFIGTVVTVVLVLVAAVEERKEALHKLEEDVVSLAEDVVEISAADRAKNEFLAILSHELRNPLAPVVSSLELLKLTDSGNPQAVNTAYEHVQRMTRLLDDLLDLSRITQQKFSLRKEIVALQPLIDRCIEMVTPLIESRNHNLKLSLPTIEVYLDADPVRVEQIVVNLLNNAAKYTDPGGTITLEAEKTSDTLLLRVRDTGIGIPKHALQTIFEPFRQVGGERGATGLGLGLSLTKQLVEMHGGTIEAKSEGLERGSELFVSMPLPEQEGARIAYNRTHGSVPTSHVSRKILVVDDNEAAAEGLLKLLAQRGHEVACVRSGNELITRLKSSTPDVILLDIGLPDINGYDLAPRIREIAPQAKLIAVTGFGQDEDKMKAQAAGFVHHLTKPVRIQDLEAAIHAAFGGEVASDT